VIVDMVKVLVAAGATPTSAVRAAVALEERATVQQARQLLELADDPADFDAGVLLVELNRGRDAVEAGR
jgi:hypothetical protein